jgi:uncharacterized SAM-binding protein YcdF (DUF218 family)
MEYIVLATLKAAVLPPTPLLLLALAGLLTVRRDPWLGRGLALAGIAGLWALATPGVARMLLGTLEPPPLALPEGAAGAGAIVVLGAGMRFDAPDYGGDTLNRWALERARYGARLHRSTGLPVLVSGGLERLGSLPEADALKATLEQDFGVPVRWVERESENTLQNAANAAAVLRSAGISRVLLVTHAAHMPRAQFAFEAAGVTAIPAATGYATRQPHALLEWLPQAGALADSRVFIHEALGIAWYRIKSALR